MAHAYAACMAAALRERDDPTVIGEERLDGVHTTRLHWVR